mmetsp:Transcript_15065/g.20172  ORF Transcript_15065/g.20172 Transcript_15065/m.20172 type:complete len:214 (-) Transcript_15065:392-1033(-)|eukprot:CAMPEP_0185772206 /NCGR_PEP_ID=MMETSP1174-20130828/67670_1 /TAXON_ID=35687 /ORGANISM="Dictyocha speculum, Strain CCMP1381" /LENGTH=213 /DNA_ID=CAMNT_0028458355 /DNA_START=63 /DNA_END=704 /DNA_ORIENTATION=+
METSSSDSETEDKKKHRKHKDKKHKKKHKKDKKRRKQDHKETGETAAVGKANVPPSTSLSSDDYFLRNTEFRVWLHLQKKAFDQMESKKTHSQFEKFITAWNEGSLDAMYYQDSIPMELIRASRRPTNHRWKFNISHRDETILSSVKETVKAATQSSSSTSSTALQVRRPKPSANRAQVAPRPAVMETGASEHPPAARAWLVTAQRGQKRSAE